MESGVVMIDLQDKNSCPTLEEIGESRTHTGVVRKWNLVRVVWRADGM